MCSTEKWRGQRKEPMNKKIEQQKSPNMTNQGKISFRKTKINKQKTKQPPQQQQKINHKRDSGADETIKKKKIQHLCNQNPGMGEGRGWCCKSTPSG